MPRRQDQPSPQSRPVVAATLIASAALAVGVFGTWFVMRPVSESPVPEQATIAPSIPAVVTLTPKETLVAANQAYDQQDWTDAIRLYQRTVAQGIDNADVRTDLGNCYRFSDQPRDALAQYELAQKQDPRHEISFFNAATLHAEGLKDFARASELLQDFLRRFPTSANAGNAQRILEDLGTRANQHDGVAEWLSRETRPETRQPTP